MFACLIPTVEPSGKAVAYRQLWAERWPTVDPHDGGDVPVGAVHGCRDAVPEFRSPLSLDEEILASAEFHKLAVKRLAAEKPVVVITFDYEWTFEGEVNYHRFDAVADLERHGWLSVVSESDDSDADPPSVVHGFISDVRADDPRLAILLDQAADGAVAVTITNRNVDWIARPSEAFMNVSSYDPAALIVLAEAQNEIRIRWRISQQRHALINLAQVAEGFNSRRDTWAQLGIKVVTEPYYRSWTENQFVILDELPDDLSAIDCWTVVLESESSNATLVVHDTGTCTILISPRSEQSDQDPGGDADDSSVHERHQHAGSLDLQAVFDTMDRVAAALPTETV